MYAVIVEVYTVNERYKVPEPGRYAAVDALT